ncbi:MAG: CPBP family intramembrane metalloprotease [Clostridioides sp.]|jgi:membrane protease YdiL (CAAX protease family)|nr:CPBP family intramembrane metalloprotease [Clostridioides sp.]
MKKVTYDRFPYVTAIASCLIPTVFTVIGSVVSQILEADEWETYAIMAAVVFISVLLAVSLIFKKRADFGLRKPEHIEKKTALLCLPLLLIEVLPVIICGFRPELYLRDFAILLLFTVFVGLNEEIWFRGIALKAVSAKGSRHAIVVTAIIFGASHAVNLFGGADFYMTLLQILFAFCVGIVLAAICVTTKSLLIPIVWHLMHNFISISTNTIGVFGDNSELFIILVQLVLLIISAVGLWRVIPETRERI